MSTYTEKHKRYYEKNKEKILERNRAYKSVYDHEYYLLHKKKKNSDRTKNKRRQNLRNLQDSVLNQVISDVPDKNVTKKISIPVIRSKT